jgi:pimeloyl-ACP methyl ester carboxylesterase
MIRDPKIPPTRALMGASKRFYLRNIELTRDMVGKITALEIPTLIIQGTRDLKCIPAVLLKMKPALEKNPKVRVKMIQHMSHELLIAGIGLFEQDVPKLIWAHRSVR